jgi:dTDP-4-amino-4,6-dideoxygalactose transaminase
MADKKYLLSDVDMGEEEALAVAEVVRGKWLSVGPRTAEFEKRFAEEMGAAHAVALSSCTAALHLALQELGIGPGDEVLVPSYTFVASANPILYLGATPVFVDINGADDLNLSIDDLAAKITPRTKAIIAVHMAGFPADMDRVTALAEEHDLKVIEDACHAIGASYAGAQDSPFRGRKAGTIGDAGCFSFFANKNLVTGEGGMLITDDAELATRVRLARSHGMTKSSWDKASGRSFGYDVVSLGYNYRCTELTSALGLIQLGKLAGANARRTELAARYREQLAGAKGLTLPFANRLDDSAHHIFPIVLDRADAREPFRQALDARGIQTSVHYPPVHEFSHYRNLAKTPVKLERTEDIAAREVTLPLHPLLEDADIDHISTVVRDCL